MADLSQALAEAYANATPGEVELHTLEIQHPAFLDDTGAPAPIRIVREFQPLAARLEQTARHNPGEMVRFEALAFDLSLPESATSPLPQLKMTLDNVCGQIQKNLDDALETGEILRVVYRPFLQRNLDLGPEIDPPPSMILVSVQITAGEIIGIVQPPDLTNRAFPSRVYTPTDFPSLL